MKKLIYIALIAIASCSTRGDNYIYLTEGKIVQVVKDEEGAIIQVKFQDAKGTYTTMWFIGADSCKVGQTLTIK